MSYRVAIFLLAAMCAASFFTPARADIGGIGSPVVPSNLPPAKNPAPTPAAEENEPAPPAPAVERKPLLIIRFNQRHVYFQHSLQQAVTASEKAKSGALYDVVSYLPTQAQRNGNDPGMNVSSVVQEMENLGVPDSRIHTRTQSSATARSQEVQIFVK